MISDDSMLAFMEASVAMWKITLLITPRGGSQQQVDSKMRAQIEIKKLEERIAAIKESRERNNPYSRRPVIQSTVVLHKEETEKLVGPLSFRDGDDAQKTVNALESLVSRHSLVRLSDLYTLVGLPITYDHEHWGWTETTGMKIEEQNNEWRLILPPAKRITASMNHLMSEPDVVSGDWNVPQGSRVNWVDGSYNVVCTTTQEEVELLRKFYYDAMDRELRDIFKEGLGQMIDRLDEIQREKGAGHGPT